MRNDSLGQRGAIGRGGLLVDLGLAIAKSYGTAFVQKTVSATSSLIDLAVHWLTKNKRDRETWLKTAKQQCYFQRFLATEACIDDFYYQTSTTGALDPMNMKFDGFGCVCYLKPTDLAHPGGPEGENERDHGREEDESQQTDSEESHGGLLEFYVLCKIRLDSVGLNRMVNHSKFEVVLDQLIFDTRHTSLPNDSADGGAQKKFDFHGRKDLTFNLNVKVFSSWINEAIMLVDNQKIGEFNVTVKIDTDDLTKEGLFIYDPVKHADKASVTGESFIVPRSYTGTADMPSWGTGQYRLEMTVSECCNVNEKWYQKPVKPGKVKESSKDKGYAKAKTEMGQQEVEA